jgi:hypothetical protein
MSVKEMVVGSVGYCTPQGLGYLMKQFYDAGIVDTVMIQPHNKNPNHYEWYPDDTIRLNNRPYGSVEGVDAWLSKVDVVIFWETPFDWPFLDYCRARGVKTVLVPMYEWTPRVLPSVPDKMICPSLLDKDYFPGSPFLPVPVTTRYWKQRTKAKRFLHNSGHIGHRGHKGTLELLKALQYIQSPIEITFRTQEPVHFEQMLNTRELSFIDRSKVNIETGDKPYDTLWDGYDVLLAAEKFNGLSLPLQEGRAAGMLVMTTDRYPTNTWLPREPLFPVSRTERACIGRQYHEFDESIVDPKAIAAKIDEWYDRDITDYSFSGKVWAEANSWESLKGSWLRELNF